MTQLAFGPENEADELELCDRFGLLAFALGSSWCGVVAGVW